MFRPALGLTTAHPRRFPEMLWCVIGCFVEPNGASQRKIDALNERLDKSSQFRQANNSSVRPHSKPVECKPKSTKKWDGQRGDKVTTVAETASKSTSSKRTARHPFFAWKVPRLRACLPQPQCLCGLIFLRGYSVVCLAAR